MTEPMTEARLAAIFKTVQQRNYQHTIVLGDCIDECAGCAVEELLAEAKRARTDAARCQATNESDLYGVIRCDKPRDHRDEHEAQTAEAYSRWTRIETALARRLSEAVERAKRAERQLAASRNALTVAAELIDRLAFDDECDYDHHDYCQAHNLHARPCPHPLGRQYVEASRAADAEQQQPEDGNRG